MQYQQYLKQPCAGIMLLKLQHGLQLVLAFPLPVYVQAVCQGLRPQEALGFLIEQMDMAGGSFKALQKQLRKQHRQLQRAAVSAAAKTNNNTDNKDLLLYADATAIASTLSPVLNPLDASLPIKAAAAGRIMSHPVADLAEYDD